MAERPEIQPSPSAFPQRSRRNLALLLIGAGSIMLLVNSRLLGALVWDLLLPIVLIGVGLDLVTEGRRRRRIGMAALVAALALAPLIGGARFIGRERKGVVPPQPRHHQVGSIQNIDRVEAHVALTTGELSIEALPERSDEVILLEEHGERAPRISRTNRTAVVRVDHPLNAGDLDLQLTRRVPVELMIDVGYGDLSSLDLNAIQLAKLDIEQTAGTAAIVLPQRGVMEISISSQYGDVAVDIPDELGARVEVTTRFGTIDVDDRFRGDNGVYLTDNYDATAADRATIRITKTAGSIRVR